MAIQRQDITPPEPISLLARNTPRERLSFQDVHISPTPVLDWDKGAWEELPARGMQVWQKLNRAQDTREAEREHEIALKVVAALAIAIFLVALYALLPALTNCLWAVCR